MSAKRDHVIQTALDLFNRYGYHAVGIDTILAKAGVAKKTLYHHFPSKDDLILAVLKHYHGQFLNWVQTEVEKKSNQPKEQLLVLFDVMHDWFRQSSFHGCMFISAMNEFSEKEESEIIEVCRQYKQAMRDYIQNLVKQAKLKHPAKLSKQISLLLEGSIVTAQVSNMPSASKDAKEAAVILIENAFN
jgi:AcrR family transcriptional regulator